MKFFSVSFFGLATALSGSLPSSYYSESGSMIFWKFPSDSSRIEYYLESISSLQPGQSVYEMWYWANNDKVRDGANEANYPRLEALMHGISDLKLHANTIDGWEGFPSCDGPDCVTTEVTVEEESSEEWSEEEWPEEEWPEEEWPDEEWSEDKWYENEEMEEKRSCGIINYAILSTANPTKYPAMHTGLGHPSTFVQVGANCNTGFELALNCDCSNVADYSFADQELCDDLKQQTESEFFEISVPQSVQPGLNKLKSLVCGNEVVDIDILTDGACTDAKKKLKAEENFIQKGFLRVECESACAEFPNETCGFLIHGVSMILFAMLTMLKY